MESGGGTDDRFFTVFCLFLIYWSLGAHSTAALHTLRYRFPIALNQDLQHGIDRSLEGEKYEAG